MNDTSKNILLSDVQGHPIVMCGQDILFEKAASPFSKPLMSRVMDGHRLSGMSIPETSEYIGCKSQ